MIKKAVAYISKNDNVPKIKAFEKLLDWCAMSVGISHAVSSFKLETSEWVNKNVDPRALATEDFKDAFGDYLAILEGKRINIMTYDEAKDMASEVEMDNSRFVKNIVIPKLSTGKILLDLANRDESNFMAFGAESNILEYKVAVFNAKIYNIPAYILYSDGNVNLLPNSANWEFANYWQPVDNKWIK